MQRRKLMSASIADFGKGFRYLGMCEKQHQDNVMSRSLLEVSQKSEQLSGTMTAQADRETIHLVETFSYYLGMCEEMKRVAKYLEQLRLYRDSLTSNLKTLQQNYEKMSKTPQGKEDKLKTLDQQVKDAAEKVFTLVFTYY